jgi:UDP-N-acetylbacillosamine N-acetyltransferase
MSKKTIIYGNGEFARIIHQNIIESGGLDVAAFTADKKYMKGKTFRGLPLVPFEDVEKIYPPKAFTMLVVIAYSVMRNREMVFNKAKAKGYRLENFIGAGVIAPKDLIMGENNIINEGVVLGAFARLGNNNMLRPHTSIAHDCHIHSHCYIANGCIIGGECEIRDLCFLGIGSTVIDSILIERETLVGAGSLVLKNTEPFSKYIGSPARKVGEHAETGIVFK